MACLLHFGWSIETHFGPIKTFIIKCSPRGPINKISFLVFKRKVSDGSFKMALKQIHKYELRWKQSIETKKV
jgi:hypothetical protein